MVISALPYLVEGDGVQLFVRVTPRAGRSAVGPVVMMADGKAVLSVRVAAPPAEGAANAAVVEIVAKALGVARRDVTIEAGEGARVKRLLVRGEGVEARLRAMIEG